MQKFLELEISRLLGSIHLDREIERRMRMPILPNVESIFNRKRWILFVSQHLRGMTNKEIAAEWTQRHNRKNSVGSRTVSWEVHYGLEWVRQLNPSGRLETILREGYRPRFTMQLMVLVIAAYKQAPLGEISALDYVLLSHRRPEKRKTKFSEYLNSFV